MSERRADTPAFRAGPQPPPETLTPTEETCMHTAQRVRKSATTPGDTRQVGGRRTTISKSAYGMAAPPAGRGRPTPQAIRRPQSSGQRGKPLAGRSPNLRRRRLRARVRVARGLSGRLSGGADRPVHIRPPPHRRTFFRAAFSAPTRASKKPTEKRSFAGGGSKPGISYRALLAMAVSEGGGGVGAPWLSCRKTQPRTGRPGVVNARFAFPGLPRLHPVRNTPGQSSQSGPRNVSGPFFLP